MKRETVLFLCSGNSARSQMAEALLREHGGERFDVFSAGMRPAGVHLMTLQVLDELGIETKGLRAKSATEFLAKITVHRAIILCEQVAKECPRLYPFALQTLYWPFEDPAAFVGPPAQAVDRFRQIRDQILDRILSWLDESQPVFGNAGDRQLQE